MVANNDGTTGQWLTANPGFTPFRLRDQEFCTAFHIRSGLNVLGTRERCFCGAEMDCLGDHTRVCVFKNVSNPVTCTSHKHLANGLRACFKKASPNISVSISEPFMRDFCADRYASAAPAATSSAAAAATTTAASAPITDYRADIELTLDKDNGDSHTWLIDVTIAATNKGSVAIDSYKAGDAAKHSEEVKRRTYNSRFDLSTMENAELVIFAVESSGSLGKEASDFCENISKHTGDSLLFKRQLLQTISVVLQKCRVTQVNIARNTSLDIPPTFPLQNLRGEKLPPPADFQQHHANAIRRKIALKPMPVKPDPPENSQPPPSSTPSTPPVSPRRSQEMATTHNSPAGAAACCSTHWAKRVQ